MPDATTRWVHKRNCSASPMTLAAVFASMVMVSLVFATAFAVLGFWLVLPFVGIELLAVALAFFCYGRHASDYEHIELRDGQVIVERADGSLVSRWTAAATWTRVETRHVGRWRKRNRVVLASRGESIEIGHLLQDDRRNMLARELKVALLHV